MGHDRVWPAAVSCVTRVDYSGRSKYSVEQQLNSGSGEWQGGTRADPYPFQDDRVPPNRK